MPNRTGPRNLSPREVRLVQLALDGLTDKAIALELGISESTVATYWARIRGKYGPLTRAQITAAYSRETCATVLQELRDENERLIDELSEETHDEWLHGGGYYYQVIEGAADAILVVREDGLIEAANSAASRLFLWERSELEGRSIEMLIPDAFKVPHDGHLREFFAHPGQRLMGEHLDTPALDKSGNELKVRATLSIMQGSFGRRAVCILRRA